MVLEKQKDSYGLYRSFTIGWPFRGHLMHTWKEMQTIIRNVIFLQRDNQSTSKMAEYPLKIQPPPNKKQNNDCC